MILIARFVINAVGLLAAAWLVPGIHIGAAGYHPTGQDWITLLVVAAIFGVVNAVIRPILLLLSLPLELLTLGLFAFVINALMLLLTPWIAHGMGLAFQIDGFVSALLGALIISIFSFLLSHVLVQRR